MIAAAAADSFEAQHIQLIRRFRDRYLVHFSMGRQFVHFYYRISPPIVDVINVHPLAALMVRILLFPLLVVLALLP
jgi:hypothetical protein